MCFVRNGVGVVLLGFADVRPSSSIFLVKASTARWLVKIMPPYFLRVLGVLLNAPDAKRDRTWVRFSEWKRCSRTGMKVGV